MNKSKSLFESRTFWFGLAQLIFGAIGLATGWLEGQTATALILTGFSTIGLRNATTTPIAGVLPR